MEKEKTLTTPIRYENEPVKKETEPSDKRIFGISSENYDGRLGEIRYLVQNESPIFLGKGLYVEITDISRVKDLNRVIFAIAGIAKYTGAKEQPKDAISRVKPVLYAKVRAYDDEIAFYESLGFKVEESETGYKVKRKVLMFKRWDDIIKEYETITLQHGCTIEMAVNILLERKEKGYRPCRAVFNDIELFSDTVELNATYLQITGDTKEEHDRKIAEYAEKSRSAKKEHIKAVPALTEEWIAKGKEILFEKYWKYWETIVPIRLKDLYEGMELGCSLEIIKILNNNGTFEEAKTAIYKQDHSGMSFSLVCNMIQSLSDRGSDFVNFVK